MYGLKRDEEKSNGLMREILLGKYWFRNGAAPTKVIMELLENKHPVNRKKLRDETHLPYSQLEDTLNKLEKYHIIKQFKRGNSKMAELNKKSDIVKAIRRLKRACAREQVIHEL